MPRRRHGARERIANALAGLGPYAEDHGVKLAIEPLHPMFASDRCVVSTLAQALDLAERFPAHQAGVTVDTYHTADLLLPIPTDHVDRAENGAGHSRDVGLLVHGDFERVLLDDRFGKVRSAEVDVDQ
ncbi:hypothetical protein GCM10010340_70500 [Streptomyces griseoloalbus]|nr:hypothetical protein GCM10010340_70500 [Streptomyces albaduncus]